MLDTGQKGNMGERIAIEYLGKNNYKILDTNFFIWNFEKSKRIAEIDIVCQQKQGFFNKLKDLIKENFFLKRKNQTIIFLEVKSLFINDLDNVVFPERKVNFEKKKKMQKAIFKWLKQNKKTLDYPWRMDLITIKILKTDYLKYQIRHFKNILY